MLVGWQHHHGESSLSTIDSCHLCKVKDMDHVDNRGYVKKLVIYTPVYESIYVEETVSSISL